MRRTAAVVAAAVALCAACSSSGGDPASAPAAGTTSQAPALPAVPGVEAEVVRLRTDVAVGGRVQVRVTDTGDAPFTVTGVAIDSPGFTPLPPTSLTASFAPGRTIDLPTPYGEPVCTAGPAPVAARLTVTRPDGAVEELRVPLTGDALDVVHREECALVEVRDVVGVALTGLAGDGESLTGTVVLTRAGDDDRAVTVAEVRRSVVFDVVADGLPLELGEGEGEVSTDVVFSMATCEPHVLSETKQPFVFPLSVVVDDGEAVPVPLPVDGAQQAQLWALAERVCEQPG
jgi:hypothetical protein